MARVDVVVVGAGLAGLVAADRLCQAGLEVTLFEATEEPGGRVRTDQVDGFLLDRGFQVLNPAYPAARRLLDLEALDLQPFERGLVVAHRGGRVRLADPFRAPARLLSTLRGLPSITGVGGLAGLAAFAAYAARAAAEPGERVRARPDSAAAQALHEAGVRGAALDRLLLPFLSGVLGEEDLTTSRRFVDLVLRTFVRGTPALPAAGMAAMPHQLADRLPPGVLRTGVPVAEVSTGAVATADGSVSAHAVLVATDPGTAARLLPGVAEPAYRALTTIYHVLDAASCEPPTTVPAVHVDADRRGPVVNTSIPSLVAPSYAPPGTWLVGSTVLGAHDDSGTEAAVRAHLAEIYGVDTSGWAHLSTAALPQALPAALPPLDLRRPVRVGDGLYVAGDHRDTPSIQGALASGARAAAAMLADLGVGPAPTR